MKAKLLMLAVTAVMMAFTACTREVVIVKESDSSLQLGPGEDVIRINLTSTSNTRAARPITNSEADNNINRIAFKFLTSGGKEITGITINDVINPSTGETIITTNYSRFEVDADNNVLKIKNDLSNDETINIKFSGLEKAANLSINIIAYGYNVADGEDEVFPYPISISEDDPYRLECNNINVAETPVQEIFAGQSNENNDGKYVSVNQHGKFEKVPSILMKRQVAALLVYFEEAPVFVNNEKVSKITVSTKYNGTGFYFPASLLNTPDFNGIGNDVSLKDDDKWVHYLTFDMSKASNYKSATKYYEFEKNVNEDGSSTDKPKGKKYLLADETKEIEELECLDNTLFGSCFLLPFSGTKDYYGTSSAGHATLNICYWKKDDSDDGTEQYSLITRIPLANSNDDNKSNDAYKYNIRCNNFYYIGTKNTADNEADDDNPVSIDEPTGWDYATVSIDEDYAKSNELFN